MAASRADRQTGWGKVLPGRCSAIRAYDGAGECYSFLPTDRNGWRYALDVEARSPDQTSYVAAQLGAEGMRKWVELEVVAKLTDMPAHIVLRQFTKGGLPAILRQSGIEVQHYDTESHWISVGRCPHPS